jgi:hypothetical protein
LFDIDDAAPAGTVVPGGAFRFDLTPVMEKGGVFFVGPGEGMDDTGLKVTDMPVCLKNTFVSFSRPAFIPPVIPTGVTVLEPIANFNCVDCYCLGFCAPSTGSATFRFRILNTSAPMRTDLQYPIDVVLSVGYTVASNPPGNQNLNCRLP